MAVAVHVVNAYVPLNQFEEVEIVPTVVRRRQFPSLSRTQLLRAQMLCQDGMSEECKKYFEESMQKGSNTPPLVVFMLIDLSAGEGYYADYADIDEDADVGVLSMPYPLNYDLIQSHKVSISGTKPCGACSEESQEA
ncbi:hypothetical protein GUITHDRAFT_161374 [Guillardia theta CCMP2712]|uniref:Uncharacterized protein n=1 Tax=Guillardia theta (strain CCMP2712) TaxID=905079 RepID=L1JVL0_GUITC|nr:hypothetical protein GUITHDRAFT_161374 [Guillardia theta CCMP2712]EKX52339.1 hypothetical protein GUITHDRAFT_161374 [Guillardia theta CCMP2712]|eukprot:XP_005839319.1 hypothetical protein GUITHDRAFT_161374 [Guillardia theta CCMP2712]